MQPHPPQLPTDSLASPAPTNLKRGALLLLLLVVVVAALVAFLLPKKQVEAQRMPTPTTEQRTPRAQRAAQRAHVEAYKNPVR